MTSAQRLADREPAAELMDVPGLDPAEHRHALAGLARANWLSRSSAILWSGMREAALAAKRPWRVLDVACGGGDVGVALERRARRAGCELTVDGCDVSPTALAISTERAKQAGSAGRYFACNATAEDLPRGYDAVVSSLFLHHLTEEQALRVLANMAQATEQLVLINDMVRSQFGYWLAWVGSRLITRCPIVHADGPLSANAAFTPAEALRVAQAAGLQGASVTPVFPARFLLRWKKG